MSKLDQLLPFGTLAVVTDSFFSSTYNNKLQVLQRTALSPTPSKAGPANQGLPWPNWSKYSQLGPSLELFTQGFSSTHTAGFTGNHWAPYLLMLSLLIRVNLEQIGANTPNWAPHWSYLLQAFQVHTVPDLDRGPRLIHLWGPSQFPTFTTGGRWKHV